MRDLIWTIIILWLFWKIFDAFKSLSKTKAGPQKVYNKQTYNNSSSSKKEGEVNIDINQAKSKPHFKSGHGEYVDYEEVK